MWMVTLRAKKRRIHKWENKLILCFLAKNFKLLTWKFKSLTHLHLTLTKVSRLNLKRASNTQRVLLRLADLPLEIEKTDKWMILNDSFTKQYPPSQILKYEILELSKLSHQRKVWTNTFLSLFSLLKLWKTWIRSKVNESMGNKGWNNQI